MIGIGCILWIFTMLGIAFSTKVWHFMLTQGVMQGIATGFIFPICVCIATPRDLPLADAHDSLHFLPNGSARNVPFRLASCYREAPLVRPSPGHIVIHTFIQAQAPLSLLPSSE